LLGICFLVATGTPPRPHCNGPALSKLSPTSWFVRWLATDEKWQIALEEVISRGDATQMESADITISIEYTPWWMPTFWRNIKEFRFVTKKRSDGKIYWIPTPLNR
jgi:hypothetical protein